MVQKNQQPKVQCQTYRLRSVPTSSSRIGAGGSSSNHLPAGAQVMLVITTGLRGSSTPRLSISNSLYNSATITARTSSTKSLNISGLTKPVPFRSWKCAAYWTGWVRWEALKLQLFIMLFHPQRWFNLEVPFQLLKKKLLQFCLA